MATLFLFIVLQAIGRRSLLDEIDDLEAHAWIAMKLKNYGFLRLIRIVTFFVAIRVFRSNP